MRRSHARRTCCVGVTRPRHIKKKNKVGDCGAFPHVFGPNKPPWPFSFSGTVLSLRSKHLNTKTYSHKCQGTFRCASYKRLVVYSTALNPPSLTAIDSFSRSALIPLFGKEGYKCIAAARHIFMFPLFTRCWQELNKKAIPPPLNSLRAIYLLISACSVRRLSNGGEENEWRDSFRWSGTLRLPTESWIIRSTSVEDVIFKWGFTFQLLNCRTVIESTLRVTTNVQISPTKWKKTKNKDMSHEVLPLMKPFIFMVSFLIS